MGWLIRFVKNRDLIAENIMMALAKQSAMRQIHPDVLACVRSRLKTRGITPAANSFLKHALDTLESREYLSTPGTYAVSVQHTTRNTRAAKNCPDRVKNLARQMCSDLHISVRSIDMKSTKVMSDGIIINGRKYAVGSHCLVISRINRYLANVHREENDTDVHKVVTIKKFYTLQIDGEEVAFAQVAAHTLKRIYMESIWVVEKKTNGEKFYVAIDSIRSKLHFGPHWRLTLTNLVCAIPIWSAV